MELLGDDPDPVLVILGREIGSESTRFNEVYGTGFLVRTLRAGPSFRRKVPGPNEF